MPLRRSFLLVFALLATGCSTRAYIDGTVSYTMTPPVEGSSGALPLRALVCSDPTTVTPGPSPEGDLLVVQLGDNCVLYRTYSRPLGPWGECKVPTSEGLKPMQIQSVMMNAWPGYARGPREPLEVVLGGNADGRYMTYRFTQGGPERTASSDVCDAALKLDAPPRPLGPPETGASSDPRG